MSKAVTPILLEDLRNEMHVQFHENVIALIKATDKKQLLFITELIPPYKQALEHEKKSLVYIRSSDLTPLVVAQDYARNLSFRGLSDAVKGFRNHFSVEISEAAETIWFLLLAYGNINRKNVDAKSTAIDDLIVELQRPEMQAALDRISVNGWVRQLGAENDKFRKLLMERTEEFAQRAAYRMKPARRETNRYYRSIVAALENHLLLANTGKPFARFIAELNTLIARFRKTHSRSSAKRAGIAFSDDDTPMNETPPAAPSAEA